MVKVFLLEDDLEVQEVMREDLERANMLVSCASSAENALSKIRGFQPSIILLDHTLPEKTGIELLRELKSDPELDSIPVIIVTGKNTEETQVEALRSGADDFVTKPFFPKVLVERIRKAIGPSLATSQIDSECFIKGKLKVDIGTHRVLIEESEIPLTLTEFKILCELVKEDGKVLSRDKLREKALGNLNVTDRTIDVHMASLRKKLTEQGNAIQTVRGVGYRFCPVMEPRSC